MESMTSRLKFSKGYLFAYSIVLSVVVQLSISVVGVYNSRNVNDFSPSEFPLTYIFDPSLTPFYIRGFISSTLFIYLYWVFTRWVATTAKKAGRSYVAFMLFAIFLPIVAWIVVITFKKPISNDI